MGLDGISVNQLRINQELSSAEVNSIMASNSDEIKIVDGLSSGQRVDPDKEHEHENNEEQFSKAKSGDNEDDTQNIEEDVTKYDLSDSNKYIVKLDEEKNQILIMEKTTKHVIQAVNADELSRLVSHSINSCGSIVNKKF